VFPDTYEGLLQLKGVGPYTAAAIASFAYNIPVPVVDGNVFRVLSRFFGVSLAIDSTEGKKYFLELATRCLDVSQPALYNQAIMDFGATVCKPVAPKCDGCLLQKKCNAFQTNQVSSLPVTEKIIRKRNRWFIYFIIEQKGKFLISKRTGKDIWSNLYEFPKLEVEKGKDFTHILNAIKQTCDESRPKIKTPNHNLPSNYLLSKILEGTPQKEITSLILPAQIYRQMLTHQNIRASVVMLSFSPKILLPLEGEWKKASEMEVLPFPKIIRDILSDYPVK
jgi:A/G-specific adenine glycosylase